MKTEVTINGILFKHFMYDIFIPKSAKINFIFHDYENESSMPLALEITSEKLEVKTKFSFLGKISFFYDNNIEKFLFQIPIYGQSHFNNSPTIIYYKKVIRPFLENLKDNGYTVESELSKLTEIENRQFPNNLTPGTKEWGEDKRNLMIFIFFFLEFMVGISTFENGLNSSSLTSFFLATFFIFLVCFISYKALKKIKK